MSDGARYRLRYTKPSAFEDGRPCKVYCDADDAAADEVLVEVPGVRYRELRFGRMERFPDTWDMQLDVVLAMLEACFQQGVDHQKVKVRDTLRDVIGI